MAGCEKEDSERQEKVYLPEVTYMEVKPGLDQEFTVTGDVFAHQISSLTSEIRGKVESISVKEGDTVTSGQTLLRLSSSEVTSSFNTASTTLQNAQISLQGTKLSSDKNIEAAKIALETSQTNLKNIITQNKSLKIQAEETLNSAKIGVDLGISSAQTSLDNTIQSVLTVVQTAVTAEDKILGISETYKYTNDAYENNLGALNKLGKADAEKALRNLLSEVASYSSSYENALALLAFTEDSLDKTLSTLNSSITGSTYTQTTLTTDINSITTQLTAIKAKISALLSAKSAIDTAKQNTNGSSQAVISAKAAYDATLAQLTANEENAKKAVKSAQNSLDNAKQTANLSQIGAKSSVDSAYGTYDQARITQNKLNITAPFAGKISEVSVKKGSEVNPGTSLVTVEDDSKLKLVAYLSSDDVEKVEVGDVALINKNGEISAITSISPSADPITKKYKVELEHESDKLDPGELIKLTFITGEKIYNGDRIFVPLPSLHILPDELYVWKLDNRKTVKAVVTVGEIVGDYVEVLSGLAEGDEIISEGGRLIEEEGTLVKITNKPMPKLPK
jgi:RND family efflux transporter MFP subunit